MGVNGNYSVPCVTDTFTSPHECFYSQQPHGFLSSDFAVFIVLGTEPKDSHVLGRQALSGSTIFLLLNFISLYCPGFEFTVAQADCELVISFCLLSSGGDRPAPFGLATWLFLICHKDGK